MTAWIEVIAPRMCMMITAQTGIRIRHLKNFRLLGGSLAEERVFEISPRDSISFDDFGDRSQFNMGKSTCN
jgi:hypothetical protein